MSFCMQAGTISREDYTRHLIPKNYMIVFHFVCLHGLFHEKYILIIKYQ